MLKQADLQAIIALHNEGKSVREIAKVLSISKNTVHKYVRQYEDLYQNALTQNEEDTLKYQEFLMADPRRKESGPRKRSKLTPEVLALIERILDDEQKSPTLPGVKKKLSMSQIHRMVVEAGYDISLSTVSNAIRDMQPAEEKCRIRQIRRERPDRKAD